MDRTIRLFDTDAYAKEFSSEVLSCEKSGDAFETILKETLFFPEQGGQSPDKGVLGGEIIIDVQNREGVIVHITKEEPAIEEGQIQGTIDWDHRFSNMQQHTGEHIFSGILNRKYGYHNVGFHLSDNIVTLDTSGPLTRDQIEEVELEANRIIIENHRVKSVFPSKSELDFIEYRCKDGIEGEVRLVEIEGVDICACCAPHVMSTCQIGVLKVIDFQNYKGGTRISILCGYRALEYIRTNDEILKSLTNDLSCKRDEIISFVQKLRDDKNQIVGKIKDIQAKQLEKNIKEVENNHSPLIFTEVDDSNIIRLSVNKLVENHDGYSGIFSGHDGNYRYVIGSSMMDCQDMAKKLKEHGAKGGGSKQMIQGSLELNEAEIKRLWNEL